MKFRIYYGDGSTFEGDDPAKAPPLDVQVIRYFDGKTESLIHKRDFYLFVDGQIIGVDGLTDFVDQMLCQLPDKVVKGRTMLTKDFQVIFNRANEEYL